MTSGIKINYFKIKYKSYKVYHKNKKKSKFSIDQKCQKHNLTYT